MKTIKEYEEYKRFFETPVHRMKKAYNHTEMTAREVIAYFLYEIRLQTKMQSFSLLEAYNYTVWSLYECPAHLHEIDTDFDIKKHLSFEEYSEYMLKAVIEPFPVLPQPIREQAYYYWMDAPKHIKTDERLLKKLRAALRADTK